MPLIGGNQNSLYENLRPNLSSQIGIPNLGGQAYFGFNTNAFPNTNSMGGTTTFNQGPTDPNNGWNNTLGSYGNGPMSSMNPSNPFNSNSYNGGNPFSGNLFQNNNLGGTQN